MYIKIKSITCTAMYSMLYSIVYRIMYNITHIKLVPAQTPEYTPSICISIMYSIMKIMMEKNKNVCPNPPDHSCSRILLVLLFNNNHGVFID